MVKRALIFIVVLITLSSCRWDMSYYRWEDFSIEIIDNASTPQEIVYLDVNNPIEVTRLGFLIRPVFYRIIADTRTFGTCPISNTRLHSITSIVVKAISENSDAGIDITALLEGRPSRISLPQPSIGELIDNFNRGGFCADAFLLNEMLYLHFREDKSIDLTGKQTFEITITFDDGIVLTQKTEELTLI